MTADETVSPLMHNMQQLIRLSATEQYCDITFRNSPPLLGVRLKPTLNAALMYGAGARKLHELLRSIETRSGAKFNAGDVWVIVSFPDGIPTSEHLAKVDLEDGNQEVVPGVSLRQMAREIYHCEDDDSAEMMLRRVLAA